MNKKNVSVDIINIVKSKHFKSNFDLFYIENAIIKIKNLLIKYLLVIIF